MKAILVNDDRSLRWDNVPDPVCGAEDCLVKIEAAALNRADLMQREGDYPPPPGCPEWMGLEIAGVVAEYRIRTGNRSRHRQRNIKIPICDRSTGIGRLHQLHQHFAVIFQRIHGRIR